MSLIFDRMSASLNFVPMKFEEKLSQKKPTNPFQLTFQELDEITEVGIYLRTFETQSVPS